LTLLILVILFLAYNSNLLSPKFKNEEIDFSTPCQCSVSSFCAATNQAKIEELTEKAWQHGLSILTAPFVSMPNESLLNPENRLRSILAWCEKSIDQRGIF